MIAFLRSMWHFVVVLLGEIGFLTALFQGLPEMAGSDFLIVVTRTVLIVGAAGFMILLILSVYWRLHVKTRHDLMAAADELESHRTRLYYFDEQNVRRLEKRSDIWIEVEQLLSKFHIPCPSETSDLIERIKLLDTIAAYARHGDLKGARAAARRHSDQE